MSATRPTGSSGGTRRCTWPVLVVVLAGGISCGTPAEPTGLGAQPSGDPLPFEAGLHVLILQGDAFRCPGQSAAGISYVATTVMLTPEGSAWVARSSSPTGVGAYEFRLMRDTRTAVAVGPVPLVGTAIGMVASTRGILPGPGPDTSFVLGGAGPVALEGTMASTGFIASGQASGEIVFRSGQGLSIACDAGPILWSLSRSGG